jgi:hypothetical protein
MPGVTQEYVRLCELPECPAWPLDHRWADGTAVTRDEYATIAVLWAYAESMRRRRAVERSRPQRTAMRLLRSLLSTEQLRQLRSKSFVVVAPSGNRYRLWPRTGQVERIELHGRKWFAVWSYCLHDDPGDDGQRMPPADLSLAHMLHLLTDEAAFLREANATPAQDQLWNRDYLARRRVIRAERERTIPA